MARIIRIKNLTDSTKDWGTGKTFSPNEEYLIPTDTVSKIELYSKNDTFLGVLNTEAQIGDGSEYFSSLNKQLEWIKGDGIQDVCIADEVSGVRGEVTANKEQVVIMRGPTGAIGGPGVLIPNILDMNESNGGVSRDTSIDDSWTNVFSYTGKGLLTGFLLSLESANNGWAIRLVRNETHDVFLGSSGILTKDITNNSIYGLNKTFNETAAMGLGLSLKTNILYFQAPLLYPIPFDTRIELKVKRLVSNKKFKAGLISITKDS